MPPVLNPRTFTVLAADTIDDDGLQWIEVMPVATKARNGPWFFTVTRDDLEAYAESIRGQGGQTPIDYDHSYQEGNGTRAAGWFTGQAEVRGDDDEARLVAQVRWTPAAVEAIRNGEYRFISPEFTFADKDTKTGLFSKAKELLAATLTNRPFFKQLAPVGSELLWDANEGLERLREQLHALLNPGMGESRYWVMDVAPTKALVREYGADPGTWVVPFTVTDGDIQISPSSDWMEAQQEWVAAALAAATANEGRRPATEGEHMPLKDIAAALGLPEDADEAAITAAATAAKAAADKPADTEGVVVSHEKLAELEAAAAKSEQTAKELLDTKIDSLLTAAVTAGRIVPAQKDSLKAWGERDLDALVAHIESTPEHTFKLVAAGSGDDTETTVDASEFEKGSIHKVDAASLRIHEKAIEILTAASKGDSYTEDEYARAAEKAERELATA